jgi:hypothetical protein
MKRTHCLYTRQQLQQRLSELGIAFTVRAQRQRPWGTVVCPLRCAGDTHVNGCLYHTHLFQPVTLSSKTLI